jgi:hypothetical protein
MKRRKEKKSRRGVEPKRQARKGGELSVFAGIVEAQEY